VDIRIKKCRECGFEGILKDFCKKKDLCKSCESAKNKIYRETHKKQISLAGKIWRKAHKKQISLYNKLYSRAHKEEIKIRGKIYYAHNIDKIKTYQEANKDKLKKYKKIYRETNKKKIKNWSKAYQKINKEKLNARAKVYREAPKSKLSRNISRAIHKALAENKKGRHWEDLVGYTAEKLKKHLEKQFVNGMSWENYGKDGWHLDHKIPISVFNFTKSEHRDFKRCWALKNLQPMWALDNLEKHAKLTQPFQPSLLI
jgi:hypothetical protein